MAAKIKYNCAAQLVWDDVAKLTSGVGYLRGRPHFDGSLAEAVRRYFELPRANRSFARLHLDPQPGLENRTSLTAADVEAIGKRADFPTA